MDIDKLIDLIVKSGADIDRKAVDPSATFEELGLDSMDIFNFFSEIDEEFGVDVPDEDFEDLTSVSEVQQYLELKLNG